MIMAELPASKFLQQTPLERAFNRLYGWLIGAGLTSRNNALLEVVGRKSGRHYTTPVYLLIIGGRTFLVCPRGRSQWVRNAEVNGKVWLKRRGERIEYALRPVLDADRPELLRAYLDRFKFIVQRYFPLPADSPASAFASIADRYPVFQLVAADNFVDPGPENIVDPRP
jgi:deazaflavin-dependent oxidoreductase (nitroreductase family)